MTEGVFCDTTTFFRFLIPIVFYANKGGWVHQNTTVIGSYFIG